MSVTGFFLGNRHAIWAIVVGIVMVGFAAYQQIPVRLFPDTAPPLVNVVTAWPGATGADVDRELTDVLETELASLEGVAHTSATSQDNLSLIKIEFHYGTDVRLAAVDVQNAVSRIGEDLPDAAQRPRVTTFSTADRPVYTVGIVADDLVAARRLAEDVVAPRIQSVSGVAAVDVFGGRIAKVFVEVDPTLAEAHNVPLARVAAAVRSSNLSVPAGRLRTDKNETLLRLDHRAARPEDLEDVTIGLAGGDQLRVGSIAKVHRAAETDDSWFSIDGRRAIAVQVYRSEGANTVAVVAEVQRVVGELGRDLPSLTFVAGEESASFTEQSVSNLLTNVWQALLFAALILFLFLGRARAALVTAFTMPLSFGLTFGVMWLMGMEFNMVTLSAVILAVGMVVDASVVVLENIVRFRDSGRSPADAARMGTDEVLLPVLAGVATTLVVLLPLLGLPGFVGKVFAPLATTLVIAFSSSVLVALILVPILSLQIRDEGRIERFAGQITRPFQFAMDLLRRGYLRLLELGLRRRWLILAVAVASFVAGIVGVQRAGMDLLPRMDGGTFTVSLETDSGTSLSETTRVAQAIEKILARQPEVVLVQSQAGFEPGMKFAGGSGVMGPTQGFISVTLSARTERERSIWEIEKKVRREVAAIPGIANLVIQEVGNTAKPTTLAPVVARLTGPDPLVLDKLGAEVIALLSGVDGIVSPTRSWRRDMKRVLVDVDPREATAFGHSPLSIGQSLAMGSLGIAAGNWTPAEASAEPIEVRFAQPENPTIADFLAWPLFSSAGAVVPLRAVASDRTVVEQGLFGSEDLNPALDVRAQVDGRPLNFVVADVDAALANLALPQGYQVTLQGENKDLTESRASILSALAISVLAVYLLLVAQFRSWRHPLTVMMAVPLSISGVAAALWLTSKPVSMPVMVGLVLLVGTVVNNSILLIDRIRRSREAGQERREAIREAVGSRFRPIMMTSISTVVGMTPLAMELALGSERFSPLATAVIGGLLASTLLTLVVIPVLYDFADSIRLPGRRHRAVVVASAVVLLAALFPRSAAAEETTIDAAWRATQNHPAQTSSEQRLEAARLRTKAATGRLLPKAELSARASYLSFVEPPLISIPLVLPDGTSPEPFQLGQSVQDQYAFGLTVTQPLFAGGSLLSARLAAKAGVAAAEARRDSTEATLWLAFVKAWYGLAATKNVVEIQAQVVAAAKDREASQKRLFAAGRTTELALSTVSLKRAEAVQRLLEAQTALANAAYAIDALVGEPVVQGEIDVVAAARIRAASIVPAGPTAEIRLAQAGAKAAEARAGVAKGALFPKAGLRFGAQYANPNTRYFPIEDKWRSSWDASLVLTWNLDIGVSWNEAKSAKLEAQAARSNVKALERQSNVERDQALASVKLTAARLDVAAERVRVAQRTVKAAETALAQGRVTAAEVLERVADLGLARAVEQSVALADIVTAEKARTLSGSVGP